MIDHVMQEILTSVSAETQRAKAEFGDSYKNPHEAYGVLAEEIFEAKAEMNEVNAYYDMLISAIHKGDKVLLIKELDVLKCCAINAACELVQVAAVCAKAIHGMAGEPDAKMEK